MIFSNDFGRMALKDRESLVYYTFVIPAYAGIHKIKHIDSGFRQNDGLIRGSIDIDVAVCDSFITTNLIQVSESQTATQTPQIPEGLKP